MDQASRTNQYDVIVIGAGQAGLAAGHHLLGTGNRFVILERNARVGDTWRSRWDSLRLYSPASKDRLPGLDHQMPGSAFPTGRQMGEYLETYVDRQRLPVLTGVAVNAIARSETGEGYVVTAGDRRFEASQVIVATGAFDTPHVPAFAAELDPSIRQLHSSEYRNPSQLADGPVLVVGAAHSGADIAMDAARDHKTYLSGKSHGQIPVPLESRRGRAGYTVLSFLAQHVFTMRTPIGRKMVASVRMGGGPLLRYRRSDLMNAGVVWHEIRTTGVQDGKPMLADGTVLDVATVVWCTGFRPAYDWIKLPVVGEDGWPTQVRGVVAEAPGLYFLGIPFLYSLASMLVLGASRDAAYVVDRVVEYRAPGAAALRDLQRSPAR